MWHDLTVTNKKNSEKPTSGQVDCLPGQEILWIQVVLLPKTSVEFQEAPLPQAPVAAIFALITLATTLTANGVPVPQAVLTGDLALLSDPQYISVAVPGTIATFALLCAPPSTLPHSPSYSCLAWPGPAASPSALLTTLCKICGACTGSGPCNAVAP